MPIKNSNEICPVQGFLLTRHWQENQFGLTFTLWFSTTKGPVKLVLTEQDSIFFVESDRMDEVNRLLKNYDLRTKSLDLVSFKQKPVTALYFTSHRQCRQAANMLNNHKIQPYEFDVRPVDRFLMERFVFGYVDIYADITAIDSQNAGGFLSLYNTPIKAATNKVNHPSFTVVSFDIETSMTSDELYSIAVVGGVVNIEEGVHAHQYGSQASVKQVFMVGNDTENSVENVMFCRTAKQTLQAFLVWLKDYDPDILIGWNCIDFDLRVLQRFCDECRLNFSIGRDDTVPEWQESINTPNHYRATVPGRLVLDGIDLLKTATYHFESFSLEYVSRELLDKGKLIHSVDNRGEEITHLFDHEKAALAKYNLEDCQLVWEIFEKCQLIDFAVRRATITGLPMDRLGGSVAAFDYRYLPLLHRKGYIAPNIPENPQGVGSPGGYVMKSLPGIYDSVLVFDFKSLYPSIIRTFCIDPYSLVEGDKLLQRNSDSIDKAEYIEGYRGAIFKKSDSILPSIIGDIWQARDDAKKANNAPLSQALKINMNACYGVMGTPGCRFFNYRLPSSITLRGHDILNKTRKLFEEEELTVIYGDTDSIFVLAKGKLTENEAMQEGERLASAINLWWKDQLKDELQIDSYLELEFETHYSKFLMPTIRGSTEGSKKRYAGLKAKPRHHHESQYEYELVFKGLETVRSDWTMLAREFQKQLYGKIFNSEPWNEYVQSVISGLRKGLLDDKLVYRKRLRRALTDYHKNIPPHVQAAKKAESRRTQDGLPSRYSQGSWVSYVYTLNGPEPVEYIDSPYDYELYIERQLVPIIEGITCFLDETPSTDYVSNQMSLI